MRGTLRRLIGIFSALAIITGTTIFAINGQRATQAQQRAQHALQAAVQTYEHHAPRISFVHNGQHVGYVANVGTACAQSTIAQQTQRQLVRDHPVVRFYGENLMLHHRSLIVSATVSYSAIFGGMRTIPVQTTIQEILYSTTNTHPTVCP